MPTRKQELEADYQAGGEQDQSVEVTGETKSGIVNPKKDSARKRRKELTGLKKEIEDNLRFAVTQRRGWDAVAKEDIQFALGEQWTADEKKQLEAEQRPCMTFNKIKPMILLITGHMIQNSARIQVDPEGQEDEVFSEVVDKILAHDNKVSHINFQLSYLFAGGERAGESWLKFAIDYNEDPIFGQLEVPFLGSFKVYMDPTGGFMYDNKDCGFGFVCIKLSRQKIKMMFPDKAADIDLLTSDTLFEIFSEKKTTIEGDANNYGDSQTASKVGINEVPAEQTTQKELEQFYYIEYWKRTATTKWFLYFTKDGSYQDFDTKEEAQAAIDLRNKQAAGELQDEANQVHAELSQAAALTEMADSLAKGEAPPDNPTQVPQAEVSQNQLVEGEDYLLRPRTVFRMKICPRVVDLLLTDGLVDSPFEPYYHDFPMFHYISQWAPESDDLKLRVQSTVRSLKDPQREINKSRSSYLHILSTSANSGWIGDEDALSDGKWLELKQFGSTPGIIIRKKTGTSLERINPVAPDLANQLREKTATADLKEVSGINADLLSIDTSREVSGKAIALRIRQAVTILTPQFENFRYTKYQIAQFLVKTIPARYDAIKIEKILGTKFMNDNQLDRGRLRAYIQMIEDNRYHLNVSEIGVVDTSREETFEALADLLGKGAQIPMDVLLDFMNLPNKQEVMSKIQAFQQQQAALAQAAGAGKGK